MRCHYGMHSQDHCPAQATHELAYIGKGGKFVTGYYCLGHGAEFQRTLYAGKPVTLLPLEADKCK